jgi:uncharacterized protein
VLNLGIISDTHGLLRSEAVARLSGVSHIVHAGDIGRPEVIAGLRQIAPVIAVRGNVDTGPWARAYPCTQTVTLADRTIHVLHDIHELNFDPALRGIQVVISGHSHRSRIETVGDVLYLNPGSAGPRRFKLPVTLATLRITARGLKPVIHVIDVAS